MIQFSLKQLRYFLAAADTGNVTEAAKQLNISQPAISAAIAHLEMCFSRPLLVRHTGQGVSLTPFGRSILTRTRRLLSDAKELAQVDKGLGPIAGEISISCFEDLAPFYLPALLKAFAQDFPLISVTFRDTGFNQINRGLRQGTIDLAICYDLGLGDGVKKEILTELRPWVTLPEAHDLLSSSALTLAEVCDYPLIMTNQPQSEQFFLGLFHGLGLKPHIVQRVESVEMQRALVAKDFGIALAYTRPASDISYDGTSVFYRPVVDPVTREHIFIAHQEKFPMSRAAEAFQSFAVSWFSN